MHGLTIIYYLLLIHEGWETVDISVNETKKKNHYPHRKIPKRRSQTLKTTEDFIEIVGPDVHLREKIDLGEDINGDFSGKLCTEEMRVDYLFCV